MKKQITIKIGFNEEQGNDKMVTLVKTDGYKKDNIADQLELLGIFENLKSIQQEKIKLLGRDGKSLQ